MMKIQWIYTENAIKFSSSLVLVLVLDTVKPVAFIYKIICEGHN